MSTWSVHSKKLPPTLCLLGIQKSNELCSKVVSGCWRKNTRKTQVTDTHVCMITWWLELYEHKKANIPWAKTTRLYWLIVSHTTRDLCYMVPALLANFKNSPITLQSWLMGFLIFLTTFFEVALCHIYPWIMCAMYNMHPYFGLHLKKKKEKKAENRESG